MEEKTGETKVETVEHKTEPPMNKKDPFSIVGKVAVLLIVAALLVGGGLYLGKSMNKNSNSNNSVMPSPTVEQAMEESPTASPTPSTSSGQAQMKTVVAGPAKGTSFGAYSIDIPSGWTDKHEVTDITDKLTITKGAYELSIYQAPIGGGGCRYPGQSDAPMSQRFTEFKEIDGTTGNMIRSWNKTGNPAGQIVYTICQGGIGDISSSPTSFGAISAKSPDPADAATMKDIDSMISSITTK